MVNFRKCFCWSVFLWNGPVSFPYYFRLFYLALNQVLLMTVYFQFFSFSFLSEVISNTFRNPDSSSLPAGCLSHPECRSEFVCPARTGSSGFFRTRWFRRRVRRRWRRRSKQSPDCRQSFSFLKLLNQKRLWLLTNESLENRCH